MGGKRLPDQLAKEASVRESAAMLHNPKHPIIEKLGLAFWVFIKRTLRAPNTRINLKKTIYLSNKTKAFPIIIDIYGDQTPSNCLGLENKRTSLTACFEQQHAYLDFPITNPDIM